METILSLDISTKSTGVAVFQNSKLIHYECITASSVNVYNRIEKITERVAALLDEYKPTIVIAEEPEPAFVKNNIDVYRKLTFAHGANCMELNKRHLTMELCSSSHWRKMVGIKTGRGIARTELKKKDIELVKQLYNIDVNDDIADAILIGKSIADNVSAF